MKYKVRDEVRVIDRQAPYYGKDGVVYNTEAGTPWPVAVRFYIGGVPFTAAYAEDELVPLAEAESTAEIPVVVV